MYLVIIELTLDCVQTDFDSVISFNDFYSRVQWGLLLPLPSPTPHTHDKIYVPPIQMQSSMQVQGFTLWLVIHSMCMHSTDLIAMNNFIKHLGLHYSINATAGFDEKKRNKTKTKHVIL